MTTTRIQRARFKLHPRRGKAHRTPTMTEIAVAARDETHRATLAFVAEAERAGHSEEEDLHPARLDETSAALERALTRSPGV